MSSFSTDISKFCRKTKKGPRFVVKKVLLDLGTSVTIKTPVGDPTTWANPAPAGYVGGRARGGWQFAESVPETKEPGGEDMTGAATIGRISAGVAAVDGAGNYYITNSVPYIRRLEYEGWSSQAPEGMVRVTVEEFRRFIAKAVQELP